MAQSIADQIAAAIAGEDSSSSTNVTESSGASLSTSSKSGAQA